jgi:DNA-3-methyladenine glycosylase II
MPPRTDHQVISGKEKAAGATLEAEHALVPRAPFCFRKAREAIASFSPGQDQVSVDDAVHRPLRINGRTVLATIVTHGSIEVPRLGVTLAGDEGVDPEQFLAAIGGYFSIDDDLGPLYQKGLEDPLFGAIVARLYGLHQVRFISPFASACWAILSARTPLRAVLSVQSDVLGACVGSVEAPGGPLWPFPEPADILNAGDEKLGGAVHNARKARYLMSAAKSFHEIDADFLRAADYDQVREWLMSIDGIGPWGASLVMIRGLGRMERLPEHESALLEAASAAYGHKVTEDELATLSERYGPVKAYWAYYLRVVHEASIAPEPGAPDPL